MNSPAARLLLLAAAALPTAGCWSYGTVLMEFDSVAGYGGPGSAEPEPLVYKTTATRFPWLIRQFEGLGIGDLMNQILAFPREEHPVEDPSGFARARVEQLANVAGKDLDKLCEAAWRLLLVIEKDEHVLNRAIAVEVLGQVAEVFRARPLTADEAGLALDSDAPTVFKRRSRDLVTVLDGAWPVRGADERGQDVREAYATALRDLSELDPGNLELERSRLRAVTEAMLDESDEEVRGFTLRYLMLCLHSAASRGLAAGVRDDDPHVRETAVRRVWRLGRAGIVPWLLDELDARNKRALVPGAPQLVDPDVDVRRRLVHLAWALDLEAAAKARGNGLSALAFLVGTAQHDPEPALKLAASEALAFLVRRPVDPGGAWISEWWQGFVTRRSDKG